MMPQGLVAEGLVAVWARMLALALACVVVPLRATEDEPRVLILNGVDPYLPAFLAIDTAMRASLAADTQGRITFFSEWLDAQRFPEETFEAELVALFARKYSKVRVDVVVAFTQSALEFHDRHGARLWPGAGLVYVGFPSEAVGASALPPGATGVVTNYDPGRTLDIARRLQPGARRVVLVSGVSEFDRSIQRQARSALEIAGNAVPVEHLSGMPLPELVARLAAEPADSIVFYLAQFRDRDGRMYTPREVLQEISPTAGAPIYVIAETLIGAGAVAGSVESYEARGGLIAGQVRRALAGGTPDPGQVLLESPTRCVADARVLRRWSLDERRLPVGCEVRFKEVPAWRQYGWQIGLTLAIVAVQGMFIAALLSQRRRRRAAEEAELVQRAALGRAARLATAGELTGAIAHEINQPLGAILTNTDTAELMLDSGRDRRDELRAILANIRRDDLRASEVIQRMRDLLGQHKLERKALDLNDIVSEIETIMRAEARRRGVALQFQRAPEPMPVMGDRIQLQQVLINLVLNAMDAVAEQTDARRTVDVSVARRARVAVLTVRDRGHGVAPEHRARLFDSLFSTKPNGMGLGLSITRTIVEAHGGRVRAESGPGEGAVFEAELPLAIAADAAAPDPA